MKPFTKIASIIIGIAGLIHLYRIVFPFRVIIWSFDVPGYASIVFFILALVLSIGLWKESKTK
jgi:hypothetical protein